MPDEPGAAPAEGTAAPETSTPEWAPVADRMNELAGQVGQLTQSWQQFQQAQTPAAEPEPDPWAAILGTTEEEPEPPAQPQLDPQALQAAMQHAIQTANAPLQAQIAKFELERATEQLYTQIPQLRQVPADHPDYASNETARQATAQRVQQQIASYPPHVQQALVNDPAFIATVFKAAEAEKLAQGQAPAGGQVPSLEAAGGAHPGGNGEPVNPVHQAYGAMQRGLNPAFH